MKLFKKEEFLRVENRVSGQTYREDILADKDAAKDLGGLFLILSPGAEGEFHYHVKRESIQVYLSGNGTACFEDREISVTEGDVLFIPPGKKHRISNRSDKEVRILEFFTEPPAEFDYVKAP